MAIELEKRELRSFEIRKRKHKQKITMLVSILIVVIMVVTIFIINQVIHKNYIGYEVISKIERSDSNSAQYISYGTGVLRYSRDGAMAMDGAGNLLWNGTYEMKDPIVDIRGKYVVISDRGSKELHIFNGQGKMTTINVLNPIMKAVTSAHGVVAVLMEGDKVNYVEVYSEDSDKPKIESRTIKEENGYPIDLSISEDGRKLVTSYISINNGLAQSILTFYNYGNVGQNYIDTIVGGYDLGQTIVPDVEFVNNNTVVAFGDNKLNIVSMMQTPKLIFEESFTTEIKSVVYNSEYVGIILNNVEGEDKYQVKVYDIEGKIVLNQTINYNYENVFLSGKELVLYSDMEWMILKLNGEEKLNYKFDNKIVFVSPVNNLDKYILIDGTNMMEIKLVEKQ